MHRATALVFALFFTSLAAAAPVAPVFITPSSSASDIATQSTSAADIALPLAESVPLVVPSETYYHASEPMHSAEKSRRRSFRRRHP